MNRKPFFLFILPALLLAGILYFGKDHASRWIKNNQLQEKTSRLPHVGLIQTSAGEVRVKGYFQAQFAPVKGQTEAESLKGQPANSLVLMNLDRLQTGRLGVVEFSTSSGYRFRVQQESTLLFELWDANDAKSALLIHIEGARPVLLAQGERGKVYLVKGSHMILPEQDFPKAEHAPLLLLSQNDDNESLDAGTDESIAPIETDRIQKQNIYIEGTKILSDEYLNSVILQKRKTFQNCQANAIREQKPATGDILIGIQISADGSVNQVKLLNSQLKDDEMQSCILQVFERLKFEAFEGHPIARSYPLIFE